MSLKEQLMADYKTVMKEHDVTTKETNNLVRAAIKQHEVDQKVALEDDAGISFQSSRSSSRCVEMPADFEKAGRTDLLDGYKRD